MAERKNAVMTKTWNEETRELVWAFPGTALEPVVYVVPGIASDDPTADAALVHGYGQKIGDAAALGQSATVAEKREAMVAVRDGLVAGQWNAGRGEGDGGMLARAVAEVEGKPVAAVAKWLKTKKPAYRTALSEMPKYAERISAYRKARVAGVDVTGSVEEIDAL